jgi:predicted dehydrogenase
MTDIGLIGCGRWGRLVLRDLVALGAGVTVVASSEHAEHARSAGARNVIGHIDQLPAVAGIVVVTPTSTHADVVEALLPRGVPIFCEKPLCDDAGRARRLAELGRERLFVMEKWRYHTGVLALAEIARSGELGPVTGLRTERLGYSHPYADTDCVWTLMPHEISIAWQILGEPPRPQSAFADLAGERVLGLVAASATASGPWHLTEISVRSAAQRRTVTLLCRDGTAMLEDAYADHIVIVGNPPPNGRKSEPRISRRPIPVRMPLHDELDSFLDHLAGGPPPLAPVADAARAVETIAEMRRLAGL